MNVGNPDRAFDFASIPNCGVGLARLEFIINRMIGVHPRALLDYADLDQELRDTIDMQMSGYSDPVQFFIDKLSEGIATIAAAFAPDCLVSLRSADDRPGRASFDRTGKPRAFPERRPPRDPNRKKHRQDGERPPTPGPRGLAGCVGRHEATNPLSASALAFRRGTCRDGRVSARPRGLLAYPEAASPYRSPAPGRRSLGGWLS